MRTSFQHQSEAQSPNGPLTAATSPDTPSPGPTTQSCANPEFPVSAEHPRFSAVWGGCNGPFVVSAGNEDRPEADWGLSSPASEIRFPVRGEGPGLFCQRYMARAPSGFWGPPGTPNPLCSSLTACWRSGRRSSISLGGYQSGHSCLEWTVAMPDQPNPSPPTPTPQRRACLPHCTAK